MHFRVTNPELPSSDRLSLNSFASDSEHTAISDPKKSLDDDQEGLPRYIDDRPFPLQEKEKNLPALPVYDSEKRHRHPDDDYDPYATDHTGLFFSRSFILDVLTFLTWLDAHQSSSSSSTHAYTHPLTRTVQLESALGPDNLPYSTEIDSIPCSGVRIPQGSLCGLLAWRLVVRTPPSTKGKRPWWLSDTKRNRRNSHVNPPLPPPIQSASYSDTPVNKSRLTSISTASLPMLYSRNLTLTPEPMQRPTTMALSRQSHIHSYSPSHTHTKSHSNSNHPEHHPLPPSQPSIHDTPSSASNAVVTNFILDTSQPYNIISRDTLAALGYPTNRLPSASSPSANPHSPHWDQSAPSSSSSGSSHATNLVTLAVQNVLTKFRIARPGEASRLGVEFLHDAGVSVFFPRNGEGVGPVLYLESARLLRDVPRTIDITGARVPKLTLQQRVRALFGLG